VDDGEIRKMKAELPESLSASHRNLCKRSYRFSLPRSKVFTMKPAAIGVRVHSGWGALVAVAGQNGAEEIRFLQITVNFG
jgi:hypothetical protein